ncbi:MAG: DUF6065 family protein [Pseudomonadota bacterium]
MAETAPDPLPPNTVRATLIPGANVDPADHIRTARPTREWMDQVPQKYVYRCIPLIAANTMGWEILNPVDATATWSGGAMNTDVQVQQASPSGFGAVSHFGAGMVTFYVPFLFRTSPELGLLVTGPANHDRADRVPLEAFVRTDWLPFPFTMNWRITEPGRPVAFKAGEPIARVMPFPLALLEETTLEITELTDDPAFTRAVEAFGQARARNAQKAQADVTAWLAGGAKPTGDGVWNQQYVKAKGSGEPGFAPHQTVFHLKDPEDKRGG